MTTIFCKLVATRVVVIGLASCWAMHKTTRRLRETGLTSWREI
jgi:hypothetical protein